MNSSLPHVPEDSAGDETSLSAKDKDLEAGETVSEIVMGEIKSSFLCFETVETQRTIIREAVRGWLP